MNKEKNINKYNFNKNDNTPNTKNITNINNDKNYTRRDFLKLLGTGAAIFTIGGLSNTFGSFRNTAPFFASAQDQFVVDNILLTTQAMETVRTFGSSNRGGANYYKVTSKPTNGKLNWAGRTMVYTPNIGFIGTDSFRYRAETSSIVSREGTVIVNVKENIPNAIHKYQLKNKANQKTYYKAHDARVYFSDSGEKRFQAIVESYDAPFINQEVTALLTMNGVSATDRIELVTRVGYPTNQYPDQRSGYVFYLSNSGSQTKRFMILNKGIYEDYSYLVTPKFSLGGSLANRTIGMKAVTYVIPGTNNVKLEFYLDLDNRGDFKLYYELVDSGQIPNARFVNPSGSIAMIRCDDITNSPTLEYFEIREI